MEKKEMNNELFYLEKVETTFRTLDKALLDCVSCLANYPKKFIVAEYYRLKVKKYLYKLVELSKKGICYGKKRNEE